MADGGGEAARTQAQDGRWPLPEGWCWATLGEVLAVYDSQRIPVNSAERALRKEGAENLYPYYGATGQVDEIDDYILDGDFILLGEDGAPFFDKTKPVAYRVRGRFWVNNHAHILQAYSGGANGYFCHALNRMDYRSFVSGTTRLKLTQKAMREIPLPPPPAAEQVRIAEKIDALFAQIEAGEAALAEARRHVARYRKSVLKAAVTGALTADWRAENADKLEDGETLRARLLAERRAAWERDQIDKAQAKGKPLKGEAWKAKYKPPVEPETEGLPDLPEGWVWASAEEVTTVITKGTTPKAEALSRSEGEVPFLRVTNLTFTGALDFTDRVFVTEAVHRSALSRSAIVPGDVIMNIVGPPLGQVSVVPDTFPEWNANQAVALFRPGRGCTAKFLSVMLLQDASIGRAKRLAKATSGQVNLTLEICRNLPIPLPSPAEQAEIVALVEAALEEADRLDAQLDAQERAAKGLRQSVLKAAFGGRLVPQDPDDEPASVLLERIKAERAAAGKTTRPRRAKA